jgi:hypothetical protein
MTRFTLTTEIREREAELDVLLDDALGFLVEHEGEADARPMAYDSLAERLQRDEDRTLALIARRIQALIARKEPLDRQRDAMLEHYYAEAGPLLSQMQYLSTVVGETLLARRRRNPDVKTLTLLGVGEWKSRKVGDGWDMTEKTVIEKLSPDEQARFTEQRPHLLTAELRAYLGDLILPAKRHLEELTDEERAERMRAVVEAIEEQYGVKYRPERISVKGPLE